MISIKISVLMFCSWIPFLPYPKKFPWLFNNYTLLFLPLVFIVLTVVALLHAIFVVNTVILKLFVFEKWVFLLVMLKPQSFLLLEKIALFVIVLATLSTPVIKSMGFLLATNPSIGHPKPTICLLLTLLLSLFLKNVKGIQLTPQQCQFLTNILRQQNLEDHAPHAQINQVGTFSADKITNTEQSSNLQWVNFSLHYLL